MAPGRASAGDVSLLVLGMPEDQGETAYIGDKLSVLTDAAAIAETIHVRKESARRAETLQSGLAEYLMFK